MTTTRTSFSLKSAREWFLPSIPGRSLQDGAAEPTLSFLLYWPARAGLVRANPATTRRARKHRAMNFSLVSGVKGQSALQGGGAKGEGPATPSLRVTPS